MEFIKRRAKENDIEADDEGFEVEERSRRLPKDKEFKDLKADNKKKRKEPKLPWGRKERVVVLIVLLATAGASAFLGLSSRKWKIAGIPKLGIPEINIPFVGKKTIELSGSGGDQKKSSEVENFFRASTIDKTGVYGLYVIRLDNGTSYGVNQYASFQAASLIKLPVMVAAYSEADKGNLDLDEKYILKNGDKVKGSGSLYGKPEGYQVSYKQLLSLMGKQSDNTAYKIIKTRLGGDLIDKVIQQLGMENTSLEENLIEPYDVGILFESIWNENILSDSSKRMFFESLTETIYEDWLAKGIPKGIEFAHKFGKEINVTNDAGIVFANHPYVVVVMGDGIVDSEANILFPIISEKIYQIEKVD